MNSQGVKAELCGGMVHDNREAWEKGPRTAPELVDNIADVRESKPAPYYDAFKELNYLMTENEREIRERRLVREPATTLSGVAFSKDAFEVAAKYLDEFPILWVDAIGGIHGDIPIGTTVRIRHPFLRNRPDIFDVSEMD